MYFLCLKKFCARVKRQAEKSLKILRTDGGGEYKSKDFNKFCEGKGIMHEVTAPYTPQHNGLAERRNRILVDMTRCMLKGKNLPHSYWGEVVTTIAYILNRCLTKRLKIVTPEEAWSGAKPHVQHLKILGSICHRHIPDERRKKLDDKSEPLILIGYHPTGAYKLYDPEKNLVVISRDVVVDEAASWDWKNKNDVVTHVPCVLEDKIEITVAIPDNRRTQRTRFPSTRLVGHEVYGDGVITSGGDLVHQALMADIEPILWREALNIREWKDAMKEELEAIEKNKTWELVDLPHDKMPIDVKWVFKLKLKPDGSVAKHKTRLVAKGFCNNKELTIQRCLPL